MQCCQWRMADSESSISGSGAGFAPCAQQKKTRANTKQYIGIRLLDEDCTAYCDRHKWRTVYCSPSCPQYFCMALYGPRALYKECLSILANVLTPPARTWHMRFSQLGCWLRMAEASMCRTHAETLHRESNHPVGVSKFLSKRPRQQHLMMQDTYKTSE